MDPVVLQSGKTPKTSGNVAIHGAMEFDCDPDRLKEYYREWSSTYDVDVEDQGYTGPSVLVAVLRSPELAAVAEGLDLADPSLAIMDAGCGTGRVGKILSHAGYRNIHGCDLSLDMVKLAMETGAYGRADGNVDLHRTNTQYRDCSYDVVTCCGTFTGGHVRPGALDEVLRLARPGGFAIVSIRTSYYDASDFGEHYISLIEAGRMSLAHSVVWAPYIDEESAHYFAFQVSRAPDLSPALLPAAQGR